MTDEFNEREVKAEVESLENGRYRFSAGQPAVIGSGGFGNVLLAKDTKHNCLVAIKRISPSVLINAGRRIVNEIMLLKQLRHENIVRMTNVFTNQPRGSTTPPNTIYMVFEWVQNDLKSIIYHHPPILEDKHISWIQYQLFLALHCLHSAEVMHRDVTPTNILVNPTGTEVKLIDLGLSRVFPGDAAKMTSYVIQRWYRAPEVVMATGHDMQVDMWSAGCVLAEMLRRSPLFRLLSSKNANDEVSRTLRAQQLVRLLTVIGPPAQEDIDDIKQESVRGWLKVYCEKCVKRNKEALRIAGELIDQRKVDRYVVDLPATPEPAITQIRESLLRVSTTNPNSSETLNRVLHALALLIQARKAWPNDHRFGRPGEDVLSALQYFTGALPSLRQELPPNTSPEAFDLIEKLLSFNPKKRPTSAEALRHPFLAEWREDSDLEIKQPPVRVVDSYSTDGSEVGGVDWLQAIVREVENFQRTVTVQYDAEVEAAANPSPAPPLSKEPNQLEAAQASPYLAEIKAKHALVKSNREKFLQIAEGVMAECSSLVTEASPELLEQVRAHGPISLAHDVLSLCLDGENGIANALSLLNASIQVGNFKHVVDPADPKNLLKSFRNFIDTTPTTPLLAGSEGAAASGATTGMDEEDHEADDYPDDQQLEGH